MSRPLRLVLLTGCLLVASLEAREAGAWLGSGLSGPYASPAPILEATAVVPRVVQLGAGLVFGPVLVHLPSFHDSLTVPLAVGR